LLLWNYTALSVSFFLHEKVSSFEILPSKQESDHGMFQRKRVSQDVALWYILPRATKNCVLLSCVKVCCNPCIERPIRTLEDIEIIHDMKCYDQIWMMNTLIIARPMMN